MTYDFLVETYEPERVKIPVYSSFAITPQAMRAGALAEEVSVTA